MEEYNDKDIIICDECLNAMKHIPDGYVDLIVTDPPYKFKYTDGAGAFGTCRGKSAEKKGRTYHKELEPMSEGITDEYLEEMCRVCKAPNIYIFGSKEQVAQYLNFAISHNLNFDILTWHKTDPVPMCGNKYLSDTEYIIFMRAKGVKVYGSYESKRKYFITKSNTKDKHKFGHPTVKPLEIITTLVKNSSLEGQTVFDPFMGSGTTCVAALKTNRHYIGIDKCSEYCEIAKSRIEDEKRNMKYSVWVGGVEINDEYLSYEEAEYLADIYRREYTDVQITTVSE